MVRIITTPALPGKVVPKTPGLVGPVTPGLIVPAAAPKTPHQTKVAKKEEQASSSSCATPPAVPPPPPKAPQQNKANKMSGAMFLGPPPPPPRPSMMPHQGEMPQISVPTPKTGSGATGSGATGTCKLCGEQGRWKDMISIKIWLHRQETSADAPDEYKWEYTCVLCHARVNGLTVEEARADVMAQRSTPAYARKRTVEYKLAEEKVKAREDIEGVSRSGRRALLFSEFEELIAPLGNVVVRKLHQLTARAKNVKEYDELLESFKNERDSNKQYEMMIRLEELDQEMERNSAPLAFADKPDQEEWVAACTYSDQWVELENGRGFIRAWYICTHTKKGTVPPCCTLISSKRWRRKIDTVLWAKGQAYYCLACDCKYNHNFGMLVQFMVRGVSIFIRADVPNFDLEDVRAMYMETQKKYASMPTARELFNSLPALMPTDAEGLMRPAVASDMYDPTDPKYIADIPYTMKIWSLDRINALPAFKWDTILAMFAEKAGIEMP